MGFWASIPIIGTVINKIFDCVDDNIHSAEERANLKASIEKLQYSSDFQLALKQLEINLSDSKGNWFQRGWRPLIGWVCGLTWIFTLLIPVIVNSNYWVIQCLLNGQVVTFPIEKHLWEALIWLTGAMLGILGGLRTIEKIKGVQDKH